MDFKNYEKAVLIDLGVELVGWTHPTFARPSDLPLEIEPLERLLRALDLGECRFRRITETERASCLRDYMERKNMGSRASKRATLLCGDVDDRQGGSEDVEMRQATPS